MSVFLHNWCMCGGRCHTSALHLVLSSLSYRLKTVAAAILISRLHRVWRKCEVWACIFYPFSQPGAYSSTHGWRNTTDRPLVHHIHIHIHIHMGNLAYPFHLTYPYIQYPYIQSTQWTGKLCTTGTLSHLAGNQTQDQLAAKWQPTIPSAMHFWAKLIAKHALLLLVSSIIPIPSAKLQ